jgi:hypothetical protein
MADTTAELFMPTTSATPGGVELAIYQLRKVDVSTQTSPKRIHILAICRQNIRLKFRSINNSADLFLIELHGSSIYCHLLVIHQHEAIYLQQRLSMAVQRFMQSLFVRSFDLLPVHTVTRTLVSCELTCTGRVDFSKASDS